MHVLVTWGSKRGGTAEIAAMIGHVLRNQGIEVELRPAHDWRRARDYDAVIVGGAIYSNRWHPDARRFVARQEKRLRAVPVWLFSSGPLDSSADEKPIPPTPDVSVLMERIGAQGHATFGGRLRLDARGFPASAMARTRAGDWRQPDRIAAWGREIARALPAARPKLAIDHPARSATRLALHALAGWALCMATMEALFSILTVGAALVVHGFAAPLIFGALSWHYFGGRGAREPLQVAVVFAGTVLLLDLVVVGGALQRDFAIARSFGGFWLPLSLIFAVTWAVGAIRAMLPLSGPPRPHPRRAHA